MLPIETKAEKPRWRSAAFSSSASPRAPLCEEKPIRPGGSARGAKVAFSCTAAFGWVVPGVAVAVTDGVAAPQLATLTVNVFTALARPVESVTISRTT